MSVFLSLYPNTLGLGYVCADMPDKLMDYGILNVRPPNNSKIMSHVKRFIDYFKPTILIVRENKVVSDRDKRIALLIREIEEYAKEVGMPVHLYTREQVEDVFEIFGASTKHDRVAKILEWFPNLESHAPGAKKIYMPENYNTGIFDALALAITHHYLHE